MKRSTKASGKRLLPIDAIRLEGTAFPLAPPSQRQQGVRDERNQGATVMEKGDAETAAEIMDTPLVDAQDARWRVDDDPYENMARLARQLERERNLLAKLLSEAWDKSFLKTKITYDETELEERISDALQHLTAGIPE